MNRMCYINIKQNKTRLNTIENVTMNYINNKNNVFFLNSFFQNLTFTD